MSSLTLSALKGALDYIGDNDGECPVCGGNEDAEAPEGNVLSYSDKCPCQLIRQAIKELEG